MNQNLLGYFQAAVPLIIGLLGIVIHKAIKTPNDAQRAISLSKIAEGIAAIIIIQNPKATWAQLVQMIVNQLRITSDETTSSNIDILNRAASAALIASGVKPPNAGV